MPRSPDTIAVTVAGLGAMVLGVVTAGVFGEAFWATLVDLWRSIILPAFHALHTSGLPFCS